MYRYHSVAYFHRITDSTRNGIKTTYHTHTHTQPPSHPNLARARTPCLRECQRTRVRNTWQPLKISGQTTSHSHFTDNRVQPRRSHHHDTYASRQTSSSRWRETVSKFITEYWRARFSYAFTCAERSHERFVVGHSGHRSTRAIGLESIVEHCRRPICASHQIHPSITASSAHRFQSTSRHIITSGARAVTASARANQNRGQVRNCGTLSRSDQNIAIQPRHPPTTHHPRAPSSAIPRTP